MSDLVGRSTLVTGAGGFIGSHLAARLVADGARVRESVRYTSRSEWAALDWLGPAVAREVDSSSVGYAIDEYVI
jgi:nucleoside-diphosphate-sugar epimerase